MRMRIPKRLSQKLYVLSLIVLFLIAFFLRAYKLSGIPNGIHVDEAGIGYNAWSIAHFNVDRYRNVRPIYPQNFGYSGQSPMYTYLLTLLILLNHGELSVLLLRLPGLVFSMIAVVFGTALIAECFEDCRVTLAGAALLAVFPFYIMHGQIALDCNLMLGCSTVSLYLLMVYVKKNRTRDLILCGISFGLTLYSYALSYFAIAIFLVLAALYLMYVHKLNFKRMILWALTVCITALPILLFIIVTLFHLESFQFLGFTIANTVPARAQEISIGRFVPNVIDFFRKIMTFSGNYFDAVKPFGTMYYLSIPLVIIGCVGALYRAVISIRAKSFHADVLFLIFLGAGIITLGIKDTTPQIYQANFLFVALAYFCVNGIVWILRLIKRARTVVVSGLIVGYGISAAAFSGYYFTNYAQDAYHYSFAPPSAKQLIEYIKENTDCCALRIDYADVPEFYLFDYPISPYGWETEVHHVEAYDFGFEVTHETPIEYGCAYIVREDNQIVNEIFAMEHTDFSVIYSANNYLVYYCN